MLRPVEIPAIDDDATNGRPVTADVFGRRMDDDGSAMLQRPAEHRCCGIVHDQGYAQLAADLGHFLDGEHHQFRIGKRLGVIGARLVVGRLAEGLGIGGIDEAHLNSHGAEGIGKKVPGAAVEIGGADDVVAGLGDVLDGDGGCRLAGTDGKGGGAALQCRDTLLQHVTRRIHNARIDIAELLEGKQVCRMLGPAELIGSRLVDRYRHRSRRRIAAVGSAMENECLGIGGFDHRSVSFVDGLG